MTLLPLLLGSLLFGCAAETLSQGWEIDRTRILGVKAEPAEPTIGDTVTFEALVVNPELGVDFVLWFGCLELSASDDYGCDLGAAGDLDSLDFEDPEGLAAAGFLGAEPGYPPIYQVPADLLDELTEEEKVEGTNLLLTLMALPPSDDTGLDFEDADVELAYKRVPVSLATTPNHNPVIDHLQVDEIDLAVDAALTVTRKQTYEFLPVLSSEDGAGVEEYEYVNSDGETEIRTEEPYFSYYIPSDAGYFDQEYSLHPYGTSWTADTELDEITMWIVARDRRGGMGWYTQTIRVVD